MNITLYNKQDEIGLSTFKFSLTLPMIYFRKYPKNNDFNRKIEICADFSTKLIYFEDNDIRAFYLTFLGFGIEILSQWSY